MMLDGRFAMLPTQHTCSENSLSRGTHNVALRLDYTQQQSVWQQRGIYRG
jgi:hypothetical protein